MPNWGQIFRWIRKSEEAPLTGAPVVRREKSYSALSGYVYQYFYNGHRRSKRDHEPGDEFVFIVRTAHRNSCPVPVFVSDGAVSGWETDHNRLLSATERYAVAKMALFQAFDERSSPAVMGETVRVQAEGLALILETLGLE